MNCGSYCVYPLISATVHEKKFMFFKGKIFVPPPPHQTTSQIPYKPLYWNYLRNPHRLQFLRSCPLIIMPEKTDDSARGKTSLRSTGEGQSKENDALLGWGKVNKGNKLTGGSGSIGKPSFTEMPLGRSSRSRRASYDSAISLGLPRHDFFCITVII